MILLDPFARAVIGHRGASGSFPENTLMAFRRAIEQGADALEMDVRVTADGVPVVLHDARVDRTTNGLGAVEELPLAAVEELDAGSDQRIPRLSTVLEEFARIPFIIDVKTHGAVSAVADLIGRMEAKDRILFGSFEKGTVGALRRRGLHTVASRRQTSWFWVAARIPLIPGRVRASGFSVPEYSGRTHVVDRRFLKAARTQSLPVHVWTVDDPHDARRLWTSGVSGIISNWPERMVSVRTQLQAD